MRQRHNLVRRFRFSLNNIAIKPNFKYSRSKSISTSLNLPSIHHFNTRFRFLNYERVFPFSKSITKVGFLPLLDSFWADFISWFIRRNRFWCFNNRYPWDLQWWNFRYIHFIAQNRKGSTWMLIFFNSERWKCDLISKSQTCFMFSWPSRSIFTHNFSTLNCSS